MSRETCTCQGHIKRAVNAETIKCASIQPDITQLGGSMGEFDDVENYFLHSKYSEGYTKSENKQTNKQKTTTKKNKQTNKQKKQRFPPSSFPLHSFNTFISFLFLIYIITNSS